MAKGEFHRRETQALDKKGEVGHHLEQTVTIDDNLLPSPQELADYQAVNPDIVNFLMEATRKEQEYRHLIGKQRMDVIDRNERHEKSINMWGMIFAFLAVVLFVALSAWALYCDSEWFAGLTVFGALVAIVSVFVGKKDKKQ